MNLEKCRLTPPRLRRNNCHKLPLFCAKLTFSLRSGNSLLHIVMHIVQPDHIVQIGSHCANCATVTSVPRESHCAKGHWYMVKLQCATVTTVPLIPADCDKCARVAGRIEIRGAGSGVGRGKWESGSKVPQENFLFFESVLPVHIVNH